MNEVGCWVADGLLFDFDAERIFGFVVVAESFFEMWRSDLLRDASLESAFRYAGLIALIAIFVGQQEIIVVLVLLQRHDCNLIPYFQLHYE